MEELISKSFSQEVSLLYSIINLVVALFLSLILKLHFEKFSLTLSGKKEIARSLPFLTLIVCLIISIVKSSLALSLGLVGALSIVRFRTPIKEPEELVYLFMSIAIGLGCGANQSFFTIASTLIILGFMMLLRFRYVLDNSKDLYLSISWDSKEKIDIEDLNKIILKYVNFLDLKRLDENIDSINVCYNLTAKDSNKLLKLPKEIKARFPFLNITFIDQSRIPGI